LKEIQDLSFVDIGSLTDRIDISKLEIIHQVVPNRIARKLCIMPLSQIVLEELDDSFNFTVIESNDAVHKTEVITSEEFKHAVIRILYHEATLSDFKSIPKITKQILGKLMDFTVVCVQVIKSKFIDKRTNTNITKNDLGSLCLVDERQQKIFFCVPLLSSITLEELLAIEINHFLQNSIKNLSYLQAILSCKPEEMRSRLDAMKVIGYDSNSTERIFNEPLFIVNTTMEEIELESLNPNPMCNFFCGEIVAFEESGVFKMGLVMETISKILFKVQISPSTEKVEQLSAVKLYRFKETKKSNKKKRIQRKITNLLFCNF